MLLFAVAVLLTGVWLFLLSHGAREHGLYATLYTILATPATRSWHQFIEVAAPHLFGMGMTLFVAAHFLLFGRRIPKRWSLGISAVLFGVMFADIFAYAFIIAGVVTSGWMKLTALGVFAALSLLLLGMVAFSL
jgi:hypothetical protein